ncbi:MAG TPA: polymer-forming cytoskeletal protein [Candidatus Binataceae bacterium]|nr:polymer-forming cytoskeletal protein [Candidatus Binataceae bacterium]
MATMRITDRFFHPGSRTQQPVLDLSSRRDGAPKPSSPLPPIIGEMWAEEHTRIAVSKNAHISGKLSYQGPVRIDGNLHGEVTSTEVIVISESGSVDWRVRAPRILVLGSFEGEVSGAETVVLGPSARAKGRIQSERLTICEGARVEADLAVGHTR